MANRSPSLQVVQTDGGTKIVFSQNLFDEFQEKCIAYFTAKAADDPTCIIDTRITKGKNDHLISTSIRVADTDNKGI